MHERLITDIGYPGIYSLSVKRRGFTDIKKYNLSAKRQGFTDKQLFKLYGKKS